jgi:hypothetical protein
MSFVDYFSMRRVDMGLVFNLSIGESLQANVVVFRGAAAVVALASGSRAVLNAVAVARADATGVRVVSAVAVVHARKAASAAKIPKKGRHPTDMLIVNLLSLRLPRGKNLSPIL